MANNFIVFISDLHLGDLRITEEQEDLLVNFLTEYVMPQATRLVIAGDLFEISQRSIQEILLSSKKSISALWRVAQAIPVDYVIGNHDLFVKGFIEEFSSYQNITFHHPSCIFEVEGYKIHVEHGHQYQPEYIANPELYNALAEFGGFLDRISPEIEDIIGNFRSTLESVKDSIIPTSWKEGPEYEKDVDAYCQAAMELMDAGANYVVFGHTHRLNSMKFGGNQYVNCGDWKVNSTFATFQDGEMKVFKWEREPIPILD